MNQNIILDTDSYKASHYLCWPPGTANVFNYLESRGGAYKETVFFGLQYLLMEYLSKPVTTKDVAEAETFFSAHGLPFNSKGWYAIVKKLGGHIPLRIKAAPEGSVIPVGFPLLTAEATDPEFFWVVGWFETQVMRLWYPTTVATLSRGVKSVIKQYLVDTSDDLKGLPFKLHDFGSRGVSSRESAAIGGAAHLVNFSGSDTVVGVVLANRYYDAGMAGFSIPAAEHSTITSWGRSGEVDAYRNMLARFARPGSVLAVVSDSYNLWDAAQRLWGETLRQEVVDSGATVVIRPDSGEPVTVVNRLLYILEGKFGSTLNSKGYRVLKNVRIIQGDGLNPYVIEAILKSAKLAGFSADNLAFGMGGGLLQQVDRDTLRFAYKCSSVSIADPQELKAFNEAPADGNQSLIVQNRDVFKDPVDDPGKRSKCGRIGTACIGAQFSVVPEDSGDNILQIVFDAGEIKRTTTFAEVRARAEV